MSRKKEPVTAEQLLSDESPQEQVVIELLSQAGKLPTSYNKLFDVLGVDGFLKLIDNGRLRHLEAGRNDEANVLQAMYLAGMQARDQNTSLCGQVDNPIQPLLGSLPNRTIGKLKNNKEVADAADAGRLTGWELDKYSIEELLAVVQDRANETNYEQRERTTIAFNKASIAGFHRLIFIEDRKPTRGNVNKWLKTHVGQFENAAPPEKQKIAHAVTHFRDKFKAKLFYLEVDTKGNVIEKIPCTLTTNWQSDRKYGRYFVVNLRPEDEDTPPSVKGPKALPFLKLEP